MSELDRLLPPAQAARLETELAAAGLSEPQRRVVDRALLTVGRQAGPGPEQLDHRRVVVQRYLLDQTPEGFGDLIRACLDAAGGPGAALAVAMALELLMVGMRAGEEPAAALPADLRARLGERLMAGFEAVQALAWMIDPPAR